MDYLKIFKNRQTNGLCPVCCKKLEKQKTVIEKYKEIEFIVCEDHCNKNIKLKLIKK